MKQIMQHTRHRLATLLLLIVAMIIPKVANAAGTQPSGSGTSASPYLIATADNLLWFADQVNTGNGGICAKLTANITLEKQDYGHTHRYMIGTSNNPFYGEFDGNNKTVSGVFVEYPEWETGTGYYYAGGLFGCIKASTTTTAVVKNLTVKGNIIPPGNIRNVYYIGGVIGIAYGNVIVDNVKSRVNIDIPLCDYVDAHCGGVIASVEWFGNGNYEGTLTVSNCINYGNLNVECGEICGGVVGYIRNGSITDCLNVGSIENKFSGTTAGILGYVNSKGCTLSRCLNLGTITAAKAYSVYYKKDDIGATSLLYYKSGVGGTALKATEVSDEQLKSGEVAYLLSQGSWGQSLGNNSVNDAYPYPNKTAYQVNLSSIGFYNSITSTIPTGDFTTTIETSSQYHSNQIRIGDTRSFTVKPTATTGRYIEKVTHNGNYLPSQSVNGNVETYSYTVALNNNFEITTADISYTMNANQSTIGTAINLADNTIGSTETFTATPKVGYRIKSVTVSGVTINGTAVSGKTDGTKSFTFTVKGKNTITINTEAIPCTTTLNQSTTTLNLADNQIGSTETFTATPNAGYYIMGATINGETINGTAVSGKTDRTKSFSFIVSESNTVVINTAATYTKPTGSGFTTNLPDNLNDKQIGDTVEFTITPTAGNYITTVLHNDNELTPSATDVNGTKHYAFMVSEKNDITVNTAAIGYTKPTGAGFTTNLPDNLADKQIGSIVRFWVMDICKAEVSYNSTVLTPIRTLWDGSIEYRFTVATENVISITSITQHAYDTNGFCTICASGHPATPYADGYYEIADAGHLYWFAGKVNNNRNTTINAKLTADIVVNEDVLTADGTLNGDWTRFKTWTPIGPMDGYNGSFDGQGHTISGIVFFDNSESYIGLFKANASGSIIKNVGLVDSYFHASTYLGGICGSNNGNIENCFNAARCEAAYSSGGIAGHNDGTIANCFNIGIIDSSIKSTSGICVYSTGSVSNSYYLQGTADYGVRMDSSGSAETTEKLASQFASGEVAWLLNGSEAGENPAWRQTIGEDKYPVLDAKKGIVVYSTQEGLNSIVRPTVGTLVGAADVYNFAGIEGKEVYGIPQTGTLAAGHPYVFTTDYEYVSFVPSDEEVTDDTPTCGLTGVLEPAGKRVYGQNNTEGEDVSIVFTADALQYANTKGNTVKYGSCYINAGECFVTSGSLSAMARSIAFFGAGGTTGIDGTDAATDDHEGKAYNPQGVQVGKDYKGVVIVNGRKMVRK